MTRTEIMSLFTALLCQSFYFKFDNWYKTIDKKSAQTTSTKPL